MTEKQKMKRDFRATKKWKEFRKELKEKQKVDPITNRPLTKMCNLHHRDLNDKNYTNISNKDNFVCYNQMTHKVVHYLYNVCKREGLETTLLNLKRELEVMLVINDKELDLDE